MGEIALKNRIKCLKNASFWLIKTFAPPAASFFARGKNESQSLGGGNDRDAQYIPLVFSEANYERIDDLCQESEPEEKIESEKNSTPRKKISNGENINDLCDDLKILNRPASEKSSEGEKAIPNLPLIEIGVACNNIKKNSTKENSSCYQFSKNVESDGGDLECLASDNESDEVTMEPTPTKSTHCNNSTAETNISPQNVAAIDENKVGVNILIVNVFRNHITNIIESFGRRFGNYKQRREK